MKGRILFVGIVVAGLGVRLSLVALPLEELIGRLLPDDAFIYFVIARHLGAGAGATFDGGQPTNGFHPLWAVVMTPVFSTWPAGEVPIRVALALGAILDTLAGVGVALAVRMATEDDAAALLSSALYFFHPRLIAESVNGLETALGLALLALTLVAFLNATRAPNERRRLLAFGLAGGLLVLARTDLALVLVALIAGLLFSGGRRMTAGRLALPILIAVLVVGPWVVWGRVYTGHWVQSSGVAIPSLVQYRIQSGLAAGEGWGDLWRALLGPIVNFAVREVFIYSGVPLVAILVSAGLLVWRRSQGTAASERLVPDRRLIWPLLGALAIVSAHTLLRWYPRGWYFAPLGQAVALLAGPALAASLRLVGRGWRLAVGGLLAAILVLHAARLVREPAYAWQRDMLVGATWLAENAEQEAVVGAFNAGIYAYFSQRTVVGLDGLVDWAALAARREGRLLEYFEARGGDLLIEHEAYLWGSFGPFLGERLDERLQLVARLPATVPTYGDIVVYRVSGQ